MPQKGPPDFGLIWAFWGGLLQNQDNPTVDETDFLEAFKKIQPRHFEVSLDWQTSNLLAGEQIGGLEDVKLKLKQVR